MMRNRPGSKVQWRIGLAGGATAGVLAAAAVEVTAGLSGRSFPEVSPLAIAVASLVPNLAGGLSTVG